MIDEAMRAEMRRLVLGEGWRIGTVARRFSVHHSVVRRAIRSDGAAARPVAASALEPHKAYIVERLGKYPELTATRLILELRDRGYQRGIAIVRRFVAQVRGPKPKKAYLRVETMPGEQAQVDWGSFGWLRIGSTQRPLSCFAMVLSWSRVLFLDFALDQRLETFCAMHQRAFKLFGGVPHKILYDYVARHIVVVLCPIPLRGAAREEVRRPSVLAPERQRNADAAVDHVLPIRCSVRRLSCWSATTCSPTQSTVSGRPG